MTKRKPAVYFVDNGSTHFLESGSPSDIFIAHLEQIFETEGPDAVARFLAGRLRRSGLSLVSNTVASWLDPEPDGGFAAFRLVVERRRDRRTLTARINEVAIAKAVTKARQDFKNAGKHGPTGLAVTRVAKRLGISQAKVRQAWQRNR